MLMDNRYTIVPTIKFALTYSDGIRKVITVKTQDTIDCSYKKNGEKLSIRGVVAKIGCNFNSSLGTVGTTAYLQIDGSSEYSGQVEYIQPSQVLDLTIIKTTDSIENVVCSVDNDDQKVTLVRENEVGVFQYSIDGINWKSPTASQGMSAYECAVALGFEGSEFEWLASLKGAPGKPGEPGALGIYKTFSTIAEAENDRALIPTGKLVAVTLDPTILLVRNGTEAPGVCVCVQQINVDPNTKAIGYDYLGYLSVGPAGEPGAKGEPGTDGKSAYEYAVDAGYTGTEEEFGEMLANNSVAVTNFYMGKASECKLTNTVVGPIDLRVFGFTNAKTFKSKSVTRIDISCPSEIDDQTLIFEAPVILRAVPTLREAAKPNLTVGNNKYVADCIMKKDGKIGVFRRIEYIESYNGETILGDWLSSTGELDMGAQVQYTTYGTFEPFMEEVQSQYRKLHAYDDETDITTTSETYISVSYPIDVSNYIQGYVDEKCVSYLNEKAPEIVEGVIDEVLDDKIATKQDKLTAGSNITIDENNVISVSANGDGSLITSNQVQQMITSALTPINNSISSLDTDVDLQEDLVVTKETGGIAVGTVIPAGTSISSLLQQILAPTVPDAQYTIYFGASSDIPTSLEGYTEKATEESTLILNGVSNRYTAEDQHFVFAYPKSTGDLLSIRDSNGFENIEGWSRTEVEYNDVNYYAYYSTETLTASNFKLTFIFTDD